MEVRKGGKEGKSNVHVHEHVHVHVDEGSCSQRDRLGKSYT